MIALINSPFLVHSSYELTLSIFPIKVRAKMKAALLFEARDALLSLTLALALTLTLAVTRRGGGSSCCSGRAVRSTRRPRTAAPSPRASRPSW